MRDQGCLMWARGPWQDWMEPGVGKEGGGSSAQGQGMNSGGQCCLCHPIHVQRVTKSEICTFEHGIRGRRKDYLSR